MTGSTCDAHSYVSTASWCRCEKPSARSCDATTTLFPKSSTRTSKTSTTTSCASAKRPTALRDLVGTIVETNLSLRDYRQNQIVKKVSSWAAIIAVPAFLTGYFGMNVPYPGSGRTYGVVIATSLIIALSGTLYWAFKRAQWL